MEINYWIILGEYIKKIEKIDTLHFLYKQCKLHH